MFCLNFHRVSGTCFERSVDFIGNIQSFQNYDTFGIGRNNTLGLSCLLGTYIFLCRPRSNVNICITYLFLFGHQILPLFEASPEFCSILAYITSSRGLFRLSTTELKYLLSIPSMLISSFKNVFSVKVQMTAFRCNIKVL